MHQLESSDDFGRKLIFPIVKPETTIGRDLSCDIVLNDADVSRNHAIISVNDQGVFLKDAGSSNGTYVNNKWIQDETPLKAGAEIIIGSNQFFLRESDKEMTDDQMELTMVSAANKLRVASKPHAQPMEDGSVPLDDNSFGGGYVEATMASNLKDQVAHIYQKKINFKLHPSLEVKSGPDKRNRFLLPPGEYKIGRADECNIRLTDEKVSGQHGVLKLDSGGAIYIDNNSSNGSKLNGQSIAKENLSNGDELALGDSILVFSNPKPKPEPEPELATPGAYGEESYDGFSTPDGPARHQSLYSELKTITEAQEKAQVPKLLRWIVYAAILALAIGTYIWVGKMLG